MISRYLKHAAPIISKATFGQIFNHQIIKYQFESYPSQSSRLFSITTLIKKQEEPIKKEISKHKFKASIKKYSMKILRAGHKPR